jgi:CubicO group peptidase (beta-lactamase class C family)
VLSILVGVAIDEGRLGLDKTLAELLPEHIAEMTPQQQAITLRQLLTMTAGVTEYGSMDHQSDNPIEELLTYGMSSDPGTAFGYSDASAHFVATALRRAIDRPILDYAREKLFDPLGIDTRPAWEGNEQFTKNGFDQAGFAWLTDGTGTHTGGYGLRLTAADLVKIGQLYLDGGRWEGRQLVSESWVTESTTGQLTAEQGQGDQYGYFWWVNEDPVTPAFQAAGLFYQCIFVVPARRLVVVVTADDSEYSPSAVQVDFEPVLASVVFEPLLS